MLFCKAFCEHSLHIIVDLIYWMKFLNINWVLHLNLGEIFKPHWFNICILKNIIKLSLLPPVLNIPIHLAFSPLFHLLFIFHSVRVLSVLPELGLLLVILCSLGPHLAQSWDYTSLGNRQKLSRLLGKLED
jgi:hypothetical protein